MTAPALTAATSFAADPIHSSFGFAVGHMGVSTFRGGFADVAATVEVADDGGLTVAGEALAESISIASPVEFREHVLGPDFLDAATYPRLRFAGRAQRPGPGGEVTLAGELTIRSVTRPVVATGTWRPPAEDPFGGVRAGLELAATVDRRDYGMTWNTPLPRGGVALATEVALLVHLELLAS